MSNISFAELKKRQRNTSVEDLKDKLRKEDKGTESDNRFWKPTMIKSDKKGEIVGTSFDVIRFLPESYADFKLVAEGKFSDVYLSPIFHRKHHGFQGPNGWYFEESRSMLINSDGSEVECPVYKRVKPMWDEAKETGNTARQNKIKEYFTKSEYICNILVVKDGSNPENNGKVFLFKLTKAMKDKLDKCWKPEFEGEEVFNPFHVEKGRNFNLKLVYKNKTFGNYSGPVADYSASSFNSTPSPLADTEDEIDAIMEKAHSLFSYLQKIKSEKEINDKLDKIFSYKSDNNSSDYESKESTKEYSESESIEYPSTSNEDLTEQDKSLLEKYGDLL